MPSKQPKHPEIVKWLDAVATTGWQPSHESSPGSVGVSECTTVGFVIYEDEKQIILAGTVGMADDYDYESNNRMAIPKSWLTSRKELS
jgi:hypothetical protein